MGRSVCWIDGFSTVKKFLFIPRLENNFTRCITYLLSYLVCFWIQMMEFCLFCWNALSYSSSATYCFLKSPLLTTVLEVLIKLYLQQETILCSNGINSSPSLVCMRTCMHACSDEYHYLCPSLRSQIEKQDSHPLYKIFKISVKTQSSQPQPSYSEPHPTKQQSKKHCKLCFRSSVHYRHYVMQ